MSTLFELSAEHHELEQMLSDFDGDVSDEAKEQAIDALLGRMQDNESDIDIKLDGYVAVMAEFDWRSEGRKAEAERLSRLASQDAANSRRLKDRLLMFFVAQGIKKRETKLHRFTVAKAGGKQTLDMSPDVNVADLPEPFRTIIPEQTVVNKDAIREFLEAEGNALDYARLLERKDTLRIK